MLGDDLTTPSENAASVPGGQKTNEDLLAEIFGGSSATSSGAPTSASQPQRTTASDILSLFDSPAPTQAASPAVSSLFDLTSPVTPTPTPASVSAPAPAAAPPPKPAAPKLQSYNAYSKNDLVISLTPQRSATQKGVVDILARFQVTGSSTASGINFQVAVPKVSSNSGRPPLASHEITFVDAVSLPPLDSATANAAYVASGCRSRSDRDAADAHHCAGGCEFVKFFTSLLLQYSPLNDFSPVFWVTQSNIRLRLRISFSINGRPIQDQVDFSGFPAGLTG